MLLSSTCCGVLRRLVATCSSVVGFFVGFRVNVSNDKVSIRQNYHIISCWLVCRKFRILACILNIWITKYVGLEPFLFTLTQMLHHLLKVLEFLIMYFF